MNTITNPQDNILSYQFSGIVKKTNMANLLLGVSLLVAGAALCYASTFAAVAMISSLMFFLGIVAICFSFYLLVFRSKCIVCNKTNSIVKKHHVYMNINDFSAIKKALEDKDYLSLSRFDVEHEGNVRLSLLYSKDKQFFAIQLQKYEPFDYLPQTDIIVMEGEMAENFFNALIK